ncbi:hypothetical protein CWE09_04670 [Aliidiomarina minuta]|uniref:Uncharacterized protein n=2 Tax=Aliidiomarina minuta TaxID=880057 RepID=A0A432W7G6_9GAMM|nr:hypothetical protein CWE09_04670 [Aliidiomarina minuta]
MWTLATFLIILWVLPLVYELFVAITPAMDPATERSSRSIVDTVSNIFSWVALFLGAILAWRQWQTQRRREYLHQRIIERKKERKKTQKAEDLRKKKERLFGKRS